MNPLNNVSREIIGGAVTALVSLAYSLGFAAMIFSGSLVDGLPRGISALLIGTGLTALASALFSGFRFSVSGPDGNACTVMAGIAAAIAADLARRASPEAAVLNVFYLLAVITLITGAFLTFLGAIRAGRWIRFVPYPVIGGLIAAAGALMMLGALRVAVAARPGLTLPALLLEPEALAQLTVGLAAGAVIALVLRRSRSALALPLLLLAGAAACHLAIAATGGGYAEARQAGWYFAAPAASGLWWPWTAAGLAGTEWAFLWSHAGDIATLVLVTSLTLLINATGLEVATRTDANLDRELLIQGGANMLAPLLGGFLGHLSMNRSLINYQLGGTRRISGLVFAAVSLLLAMAGTELAALIPRALLGGLLLYFGAQLFWKWAVATRRQMARADYLILLLILRSP